MKLKIVGKIYEEEMTIKQAVAICNAYIAWQHGMHKGSFESHLKNLGLYKSKPLTEEEKRQMVQDAIEDSQKVISLLSRQKKKIR